MQVNIGQLLTKRAYVNPDLEALYDVAAGRRFSYEQLNARSNQVAHAISSTVNKGDRVALLMMNSHEFLTAFFAIAKIGGVVVPLNWRLVPNELEFILKDSGTTVLFYGEEFLPSVVELQSRGDKTDVAQWIHVGSPDTTPSFASEFNSLVDHQPGTEPTVSAFNDDLLYIMYTSGTTGLPKGVMHTHNTQMAALLTLNATSDFCVGDRYLNPMPLFHVGALSPAMITTYRGLAQILMRSFDPTKAWELVTEERINNALLVPAMLQAMRVTYDPAKHDKKSVRWFLSGAAPVPVTLIHQYLEMGIDIHQVYGLTETCGPACVTTPDIAIRKAGSTGKSYFHTEVKVVRPDGSECDDNESGEIIISGDHIMTGYWNRPDATAESIRDGWFYSGDMGIRDDEGFIFIQDRLKDMIITGGENVYPAEIENLLLSCPGVADAAVIGVPSEKWGESAIAIAVRKDPELDEKTVLAFCDGKLARFKTPVAVRFVDSIPRNASGKILKRDLRLQFPSL
ncbi:MAG: long-chain fatty acid--CoA ligase [Actinobacteria bacterium]|nr:long-chain fatty acid--CoA ligase [Actinomycetota bacterium]